MLRARPWFLGKQRYITGLELHRVLDLPETAAHLLLLSVHYGDGDPEIYLVPISVATGDQSEAILHDHPDVVLARLDGPGPKLRQFCTRQPSIATSATLSCGQSCAGGESAAIPASW